MALSPGANNFLAMQHGMRFGIAEAVAALTGRLVAFLVMLAMAVAGLATVLTRSQTAFEFIKWAGVAYLAYLGIRSFTARAARCVREQRRPAVTGRMVLARREFVTVAANPKALLLFTAFLPQFVDRSEPVAGQLLVLGPLYIALELAAASGWAFAGHRLGAADLTARVRRRMDQAVGAVFVGLAGTLATTKR